MPASTKVEAIGLFVGATHSPSKSIRAFTPVFAGYAVNALVVVAPRAKSRGEAGGHKARPYAQRFPFNFEDAHD